MESMELAVAHPIAWNHEAFLAGKLTPCSSARREQLRVMEVLNAVVDMSPHPPARGLHRGQPPPVVKPSSPKTKGFSGVVFKVQANMDANHRDRIAFVRVARANTRRA